MRLTLGLFTFVITTSAGACPNISGKYVNYFNQPGDTRIVELKQNGCESLQMRVADGSSVSDWTIPVLIDGKVHSYFGNDKQIFSFAGNQLVWKQNASQIYGDGTGNCLNDTILFELDSSKNLVQTLPAICGRASRILSWVSKRK